MSTSLKGAKVAKKVVIAKFDELSEAENAVMILDREGFPMVQISILAEGVEGSDPTEGAENFVVAVEGDAQEASRAKETLQRAETEQVEIGEEA
jgi:hypothetical protein